MPSETLTPTSGEPEQRIYTTDTAASGANSTVDIAPSGTNPQTWTIAEEIREKLTTDRSIAPLGSKLIMEVGKDGTVTVRGDVSSASEKKRVCDAISNLPGVRGVNADDLKVGRYYGEGILNTQKSQ